MPDKLRTPIGSLTPPEPRSEGWMNPLNKIIWRRAFQARRQEVQIRDGRLFKCDYSKRPGFVWVSPIGGDFTPAGWFDLDKVAKDEWID